MIATVGLALLVVAAPAAGDPPAAQILERVLDADLFGMAGAEFVAALTVRSAPGAAERQLLFSGRSRRSTARLAKGIIRFSSPPDVAGTGFLMIQRQGSDDERMLFVPELKRSRRIAATARTESFMGTDFSYADFDQRELRDARVRHLGTENIGRFGCWRIEAAPNARDTPYKRLELWVRKDNYVPLKVVMYDSGPKPLKTLVVQEMRRLEGHWLVTRSTMTTHASGRQTEFTLREIKPRNDIPDEEFTVRTLEKL
jgi:outer membrane lipoprotein-sorting protein